MAKKKKKGTKEKDQKSASASDRKDEKDSDAGQKWPLLSAVGGIITVLGAISTGLLGFAQFLALPLRSRLIGTGILAAATAIGGFWQLRRLPRRIRATKAHARHLAVAGRGLGLILVCLAAGALTWGVLEFAASYNSISIVTRQGQTNQPGTVTVDAPHTFVSVGIVIGVPPKETVKVSRSGQPGRARLSFLNQTGEGVTVCLDDFGDRERIVLAVDHVGTSRIRPTAVSCSGGDVPGWLDERDLGRIRFWGILAGGLVCVVGFFLLWPQLRWLAGQFRSKP